MRKSSDKRPAAIKSSRAAQWVASTPPVLKIRFFPYISGRGRVWDSSYMATRATTPLGRAIFQAVVKESPLPAASTTPSAPRPPVQARTRSSGFSSGVWTTRSARPRLLAKARREASVSMAMVWAAPKSRAQARVHRPTGPAPITARVSPG